MARARACWNVFWGLPLLLAPEAALPLIGLEHLPGPAFDFYARGAGLALILFALIYAQIGRDIVAARPFLAIAIVAKVAIFALGLFVWASQGGMARLMVVLIGDLAFGMLFLRDFLRPPGGR